MEHKTVIHNPILRGMYPDPSWIWDEQEQAVVVVNSSFTLVPGLPIHVSHNMSDWELLTCVAQGEVAERLMLPYAADSGGLFAPTLRKIRGKYVIACTSEYIDRSAALAGGVDPAELDRISAAEGNFVLVADDLRGPWSGPYWIEGAQGIDPDIFEDADGTVWWTQTRQALDPKWEGQTEVWCAQLDPETWSLVTLEDSQGPYVKTVLWRGYGNGAVWAEGPHLYRVGDWTYLMTAEGGTSFEHSEMIMRCYAPSELGPAMRAYLDEVAMYGEGARSRISDDSGLRATERCVLGTHRRLFEGNKKNPILTHRHLGFSESVQCVGHGDLMTLPNGQWWMCCLGVREVMRELLEENAELMGPVGAQECHSYFGRETFVAPVEWESDLAQWQLVGEGGPSRAGGPAAGGEPAHADPGWPVVAPGYGRLPQRISVITEDDGEQASLDSAQNSELFLGGTISMEVPAPGTLMDARDSKVLYFPQCLEDEGLNVMTPANLPERKFLRVASYDCRAVADASSEVLVFQDSRNHLRFGAEGSRVVCTVTRQDKEYVHDLAEVADFKWIALRMQSDTIDCWLSADIECPKCDIFDTQPALSLDARFLSSEWAGGFVGCLIGM